MRPHKDPHGLLAPLASLLVLSSLPLTMGACSLNRDPTACAAANLFEEYTCLRSQNSLRALIDCVAIDHLGEDYALCRNQDDGIPNNGNENYGTPFPGETNSRWAMCVTPRNVLLAGSDTLDCRWCSMRGLLEACPDRDPNFKVCLCSNRVRPEHFQCLARCFKQTVGENLSCRPTRKREETEDDPKPPPGKMANMKRALQLQGADFWIDDYGRPVYRDNSIGFPLPYYDELIAGGTAIKRCYIAPSSTDLWCTAWRLTTKVAPDSVTGGYRGANYGKIHQDEEDIETPTRTAAPRTTDVPTLAAATELSSISKAPTSTTSSTLGSPSNSAGSFITPSSLHRLAASLTFCVVAISCF